MGAHDAYMRHRLVKGLNPEIGTPHAGHLEWSRIRGARCILS